MAASSPLWLRAAPGIFLLLWSGGFTFAKLGLLHAPPMTFLAMRYALVLLVLLPLLVVLRPPLPKQPRDWLHLAVVGFLVQAVYFGLSYVSFSSGVSAGTVALIVSLQPVLVGLLAPRLAGEAVSARQWIGLALGLVGAAVVIVSRSTLEATSALGVLAAVGALVGMTGAAFYEKRFGVSHHPVTANFVQFAVGLAVVAPIALLTEDLQVQWSGGFVLSLAYLVVGNSLIATTLLLAMIRHGEVSRVSALLFLVPPMAALLALFVLGEQMPPLAWLGMALAAAGVAIATLRPSPPRDSTRA